MAGTLLSMASHFDELVTRINHADINCEIFTSIRISEDDSEVAVSEERLHTLIKGIGDYLMRVVGSVPIDLKITLEVYDEMDYRTLETFGPFYYTGQEAMLPSPWV